MAARQQGVTAHTSSSSISLQKESDSAPHPKLTDLDDFLLHQRSYIRERICIEEVALEMLRLEKPLNL